MCMSLSLIVEESDVTVVTARDEGWGSRRVGETTDGGQVTCTWRNKRARLIISHIVANDHAFIWYVLVRYLVLVFW